MTPISPRAILVAARALIAEPGRWTQGANGRHANGRPIGPNEANCACRCSLGAMLASDSGMGAALGAATDALGVAVGGTGSRDIVPWNDAPERTHAEVLKGFDRAIAIAGDAP